MSYSSFVKGCSPSLLPNPPFSFLPSILPCLRYPLPLLLPSCAVTAQQPGLDVSTCQRTGQHGEAELNAGSEPLCPALALGLVTWALGFVWACPLVDLLGVSQPTQSDCGLLGLDNVSISPFTYCSKVLPGLITTEQSLQNISIVTLVHLTSFFCINKYEYLNK